MAKRINKQQTKYKQNLKRCRSFISEIFPFLLELEVLMKGRNFPFLTGKRTTTSEKNKSLQPKPLRFFIEDFSTLVLGVHCFYVDEKSVQECFPQWVLKIKIRSSCFFYCLFFFLLWALLTQVYYFYMESQLLTKPWLSALTAMMRHFHFWFLAYVALNITLPLCTSYPGIMAVPAIEQWYSPSRTTRARNLCQYADVTQLIEQW